MSYIITPQDFYFELGDHNIPGKDFIHKYGRNPGLSTGAFEAIWNNTGDYTGFNATAGEAVESLSSSAADSGTLVTSGTTTGGSMTTLEDSGASFITTTPVNVGDAILDDTQNLHGVVTEVTSETVLTVARFDMGQRFSTFVISGDSYRIVTPASTGLAVVELHFLLDSDLDNETSEFIILNGTTPVDTMGTDYIRCSRVTGIIAGSGGGNAGTITCRQTTTTANVFSLIPIGYNETMISCYTIPKTFEGRIKFWKPSMSGKTNANAVARLVIGHRGEVFRVIEETDIGNTGSSKDPRDYAFPKNELPGGTDIKIMGDVDQSNTPMSAVLDIILSAI